MAKCAEFETNLQLLERGRSLRCVARAEIQHPQFCSYEERLKSFVGWNYNVQKEQLAKYAFFATGFEDYTTCFFCDLSLGKWSKTDSPLQEHKRYSKNCGYLMLIEERESASGPEPGVETSDYSMDYMSVLQTNQTEDSKSCSPTAEAKRPEDVAERKSDCCPDEDLNSKSCSPTAEAKRPEDVAERKSDCCPDEDLDSNSGSNTAEAKRPEDVAERKSDCCPDEDLDAAATQKMKEENKRLHEMLSCKTCMKSNLSVVFLPCAHLITCGECAVRHETCPKCKFEVKGFLKPIM